MIGFLVSFSTNLKRYAVFVGLCFSLDSLAQLPQIKTQYFQGNPDSALALINEYDFHRDQMDWIQIYRWEGFAWAMKGNLENARQAFSKSIAQSDADNDHALEAWNNALLSKMAYWEIQPEEAQHFAHLALEHLNECDDHTIELYDLHLIWNIAAQAEKQVVSRYESQDKHLRYGKVDSLFQRAVDFHRDHNSEASFTASTFHTWGNSYTDRVSFSSHDKIAQKEYLKKATELYNLEQSLLLENYGPDHPNIPQASFTNNLAHKYARVSVETMDSLYRFSYDAYFPHGDDKLPVSLQSGLMYLMSYTDFLLENPKHENLIGWESRFHSLTTQAHQIWKELMSSIASQGEAEMLAIYSLIPPLNDVRYELMKFDQGEQPDLDVICQNNQYLKYYDTYIKRQGQSFPQVKSIAQVQSQLSSGDLVLDFINPDDREVYVLSITQNHASLCRLPDDFIEDSELFVRTIAEQKPDFQRIGNKLYKDLIESSGYDLKSQKRLLISPPIRSKGIPFEALSTAPVSSMSSSIPFLLDPVITYHYSLAFLQTNVGTLGLPVASITPEYQRNLELPFAEQMDESLAKKHPNSWIKQGIDELAISTTETFGFLHISTHGFASELRPEEVTLDHESSPFHLNDFINRNSPNRFVVINACRSGDGRYIGLNGVESPVRKCLASGAHGAISNLWEVDDQRTASLFEGFYESLFLGDHSALALNETKKDYLANAESERAKHPYYWAASLHYGLSVRPLTSTTSRFQWWWFMLLPLGAYLYHRAKRRQRNEART